METAEKKVKRAVRKREKLKAVREAAASGPATAYLNNVPTSPRKMRLVVDLIRGQRVNKALNILIWVTHTKIKINITFQCFTNFRNFALNIIGLAFIFCFSGY